MRPQELCADGEQVSLHEGQRADCGQCGRRFRRADRLLKGQPGIPILPARPPGDSLLIYASGPLIVLKNVFEPHDVRFIFWPPNWG